MKRDELDKIETRDPDGPRVLVCGGADYADRTQVLFELDQIRPSLVVHDSAPPGSIGVAALATLWCRTERVAEYAHRFDLLERQGEQGPHCRIDRILAFPGTNGPALFAYAERFGAEIKEVPAYTRVVHCKRHPYNVYGGRPGPYGNLFSHKHETAARYHVASRDEAVDKHEEWFLSNPEVIERVKREMTGKVIGCWCAPQRCHCDIYAKVCNEAAGLIDTTGTRRVLQADLFAAQ
jgi:hypothetical protein